MSLFNLYYLTLDMIDSLSACKEGYKNRNNGNSNKFSQPDADKIIILFEVLESLLTEGISGIRLPSSSISIRFTLKSLYIK